MGGDDTSIHAAISFNQNDSTSLNRAIADINLFLSQPTNQGVRAKFKDLGPQNQVLVRVAQPLRDHLFKGIAIQNHPLVTVRMRSMTQFARPISRLMSGLA
jgi:hypothetical protein